MNHKYQIIPEYSFDEIPESRRERLSMFAAAAWHLSEVYLWVYGKEGSRRGYRYARFMTLAVLTGKMTVTEAAKEAEVSEECIYMHRKDFMNQFNKPEKESSETNEQEG